MVVLAGLTTIQCRPDPAEEIVRLVPGMPMEVARHLAHDTDAELLAYASDTGLDTFVQARAGLARAPGRAAAKDFATVEAKLATYMMRVVAVMESEFALTSEARRYRAYRSHGFAERRWITSIVIDLADVPTDPTLTIEEKARLYRRHIEETRDYAEVISRGAIYTNYCELVPRMTSNPSETRECLMTGIMEAETHGDWPSACQMLGALGAYYNRQGQFDEMRDCWDRALVYARRTKSWHEARILGFYATWFAKRGQLAMARDLRLRAMDRCRALKGFEIRFILEWIDFLVALECWDLAGRELHRAEALLERHQGEGEKHRPRWWEARLLELRMTLAASDKTRRLELTPHEALAQIEALPDGIFRERTRLRVLRALLRSGTMLEILAALEAGREICVASNLFEFVPEYDLLLARAELDMGDIAACEAALTRFRAAPEAVLEGNDWLEHDAVQARAALGDGRMAEGRRSVETGFDRLASEYRRMDGSPETGLSLRNGRELLAVAHDMVGQTAIGGYDLELLWRRLRSCTPAAGDLVWAPGSSLVGRSKSEGAALRASLASAGTIHIAYSVAGDRLRRWTVTGGEVDCDTLATDLLGVARRAKALAAHLADSDGDGLSDDASYLSESHDLARLLLPAVVFESEVPLLLLISADGFLLGISFESLNLEPTSFAPLGARHQVATLVPAIRGRGKVAAGTPLGILNPTMPQTLSWRHPILTEELAHSAAEVDRFCALFPRTQRLSGASATKPALLARWEEAPLLYFATHVVHDPEVPYIAFLPLAAAEEGGVQDSYLEVADIRRADLTGCKLVVLSGCSTGAPYVTMGAASPSLGEAFVQAGAHAVVHTYWPVRDDAAASVMEGFIRAYAETGDAVAAMTRARVLAIERDLDPRAWLAYSVMVNAASLQRAAPAGAPAKASMPRVAPSP